MLSAAIGEMSAYSMARLDGFQKVTVVHGSGTQSVKMGVKIRDGLGVEFTTVKVYGKCGNKARQG